MRSKLLMSLAATLLVCALLVPVLLVPRSAQAALITASTSTIGLGQTTIELTLDPEGVAAAAWLVVLSGSGLSIDSISGVAPGSTDCSGNTSAMSFEAQCAAMPLGSAAVVAQLMVTGLSLGGTLMLVSGNITDDVTFDDIAFTPGILLTVVPEPVTGLLVGLGLLGLALPLRRSVRR